MKGKQTRESGDKAAALLATCFTVVGGMFVCTFIGVMTSHDSTATMVTCGLCFTAIVGVLWLLRDKPPVNPTAAQFGWLSRNRKNEAPIYIPRRRHEPEEVDYDRNKAPPAPPTAETVRQLQEENAVKTWVPSKAPPSHSGRKSSPNPEA